MIRAAAKNHAFTRRRRQRPRATTRCSRSCGPRTALLSMPTREHLAAEAFALHRALRHGDRPLVRRARTRTSRRCWSARSRRSSTCPTARTRTSGPPTTSSVGARMHVLSMVRQHHGKQLSFNNLLDLDSARGAGARASRSRRCAIVKHNNPCGAALGRTALEAYRRAFACDPLSAFGGVIALNRPVDRELAEALAEQFVEVLFAPGYDDDALEVLTQQAQRPDPRRTTSGGCRTPASPTSSRSRAACSCRTATRATRSAARWRSSRSAPRPSRSGATCSSPGGWASTSSPTRSCWPRSSRRWASAPAR